MNPVMCQYLDMSYLKLTKNKQSATGQRPQKVDGTKIIEQTPPQSELKSAGHESSNKKHSTRGTEIH